MARHVAPFVLIVLIAAGLYGYVKHRGDAPDPYAACEKTPPGAERDACRSQVDFAMSAGW